MKPAAIVIREHWSFGQVYSITTIDGQVRSFERAQHAMDWLDHYLPGALIEWNV